MIRINLLITDRRARRKKKAAAGAGKPLPIIAIALVLITLATIGSSAYLVVDINAQLVKLKKEKDEKTVKLEDLKKKIKKVEELDQLIARYDNNRKLIEELRANQSIPVMLVDEVSKQLPENVWLKSVDLTGNNVSVTGTAFANDDVVKFINNFKASPRFQDVYLKATASAIDRSEGVEIPVYSFGINMTIKVVPAEPAGQPAAGQVPSGKG